MPKTNISYWSMTVREINNNSEEYEDLIKLVSKEISSFPYSMFDPNDFVKSKIVVKKSNAYKNFIDKIDGFFQQLETQHLRYVSNFPCTYNLKNESVKIDSFDFSDFYSPEDNWKLDLKYTSKNYEVFEEKIMANGYTLYKLNEIGIPNPIVMTEQIADSIDRYKRNDF